jgi:DNA repair exonuclease SbcCD ATPase subunit
VKISRQLCANTSGSEALALQYRTDQLHKRYDSIAKEAETRIDILSKATPLSEDFHEGVAEITEHLDGVEEDLQNLDQVTLEEQFQLVNTIESDLSTSRARLETLQAINVKLQKLTSESNAEQLQKQTNELFQRFSSVSETVSSFLNKIPAITRLGKSSCRKAEAS